MLEKQIYKLRETNACQKSSKSSLLGGRFFEITCSLALFSRIFLIFRISYRYLWVFSADFFLRKICGFRTHSIPNKFKSSTGHAF